MEAGGTTATVEIAPDVQGLAQTAADWLVARIAETRGPFRLAMTGGQTPRPLYRLLASDAFRPRIAWERVELFWGDERLVPHDHPDSNYRMARETLLDHVPIPPEQIHPMPTDGTAPQCARDYEALLKRCYGAEVLHAERPLFDAVLLGLGGDGHTASLLPGDAALEEYERWVTAVMHGRPHERVTLTYPTIASSRDVAFLVSGTAKADTFAAVRAGAPGLPAARIRSHGRITWFVDRAAAAPARRNTNPMEPHDRTD